MSPPSSQGTSSTRRRPALRDQAFTVDSAGALAKVTGSPFGTASVHAGALAFHPNGKFVYGASGLVTGFAIDAATPVR